MKKYDFDQIVPRRGTSCVKYDVMDKMTGRTDLIPLWVADMDFNTPDFIVDALRRRVENPIYGYTSLPDDYFAVISSWVSRTHQWEVLPSDMRFIPGIVRGISMALAALFPKGTKVIIQPPVYHPFRFIPQKNGYEVVYNPMIPRYSESEASLPEKDRTLLGYDMDFDGLGRLIDDGAKVLILSNPHNPAGITWSRDTLLRLAELTSSRGVVVISDEIHSEMVLPRTDGSAPGSDGLCWPIHVPYASVSPQAASNSITFMAPSKTFNIAGVVSSYAIVLDKGLQDRFFSYLEANEFDAPPLFSIVATMAAYSEGDSWRKQMLAYVKENVDFVEDFLRENIKGVRALRPSASFLMWLDCRSLRLSQKDLVSLFVDKAGLYLNDGSIFGSFTPSGESVGGEGIGFMRLNVGCPRSVLKEALERLSAVLREK